MAQEAGDGLGGRRVRPLQVVERDDDRTFGPKRFEEFAYGAVQAAAGEPCGRDGVELALPLERVGEHAEVGVALERQVRAAQDPDATALRMTRDHF
jgi:hypothetical protein